MQKTLNKTLYNKQIEVKVFFQKKRFMKNMS